MDLTSSTSLAWAAWFQGIGTVAAFFASIGIWWHAHLQNRRAAAREQASKVAMWVEEDIQAGTKQLLYVNASGLPVHNIIVTTSRLTMQQQPVAFKDTRAGFYSALTLPPAPNPQPVGVFLSDIEDNRILGMNVSSFTFFDAAGQQWHRNEKGRLMGPFFPTGRRARLRYKIHALLTLNRDQRQAQAWADGSS